MSNRVVVAARSWESIPGLLKRFTKSGSGHAFVQDRKER